MEIGDNRSDDRWWMGRTVIITGVTGLIGLWLASALVKRGAHIWGICRQANSAVGILERFDLAQQVRLVLGSIECNKIIEDVLARADAGVVFHLAAQSQVKAAEESPRQTLEVNVRGTWNLLEAVRVMAPTTRIIIASTQTADGTMMALAQRGTYAVSKACAELVARLYATHQGLRLTVFRTSNVYGGGDRNPARLVPSIIVAIAGGRRPQLRSNAGEKRDFIYVEDLVDGLLRLAVHINQAREPEEPLTFASGQLLPIVGMAKKIAEAMGQPNLLPQVMGKVTDNIDQVPLSIEPTQRVLGWQPRTSIAEGISRTVDWYRAKGILPEADQ